MTRDEERRVEVAELFEGLSVFDRGVRHRASTIGYSQTGSWLAPKPRKAKPAKAKPAPRVKLTREERLRRKAASANAAYHALSSEEKRARNAKLWAATESSPERLEAHRAYNRERARRLRAEGKSYYQCLTAEQRKAANKARYAAATATPELCEQRRAAYREWMRKDRARLRAQAQAAE